MDKSSFFFTANCGVCHPGGAAMQYDRTGKLYYDWSTGLYGYNDGVSLPATAKLDGDYGFINPASGVAGTASWAKTGVSEPDCLMCHMGKFATAPGTSTHNAGLSWHKRSGTLRGTSVAGVANFEWAPTAGAGWAAVTYVAGQSPPMASAVTIDYGLGITAGTLVANGGFLEIAGTVIEGAKDSNCRGCHSIPDGKKSGRTLLPTTDAHTARGIGCTRCHTSPSTGQLDSKGVAMANPHQIGKGDITIGSVRNDLDNSVKSCTGCHLGGEDLQAPNPTAKHGAIPGGHFTFLKCQVCHIRHLDDDPVSPTQDIPELVIEMSSNGTQNVSLWSTYLGTDPLDPTRNLAELAGRPFRWYPAVRSYKGKLQTVKPLYTSWFGEWIDGTGDAARIRPIPLRLVRKALTNGYAAGTARLAGLTLTPGTKVASGAPILHRKAEIKAFLTTLRDAVDASNVDGDNDIVVRPVLVRAEKVYYLNDAGEVEYFHSAVGESHDFAVNHNVVAKRDPANPVVSPGPYGAGGCNDCHGPRSPFFYTRQLVEPAQYDFLDEAGTIANPDAGKPRYAFHYEAMGYSEARAGQLTGTLVPVHVNMNGPYGAVDVTDGVRSATFTAGGYSFAATPGSTVTFTVTPIAGATLTGFTGCTVGATPNTCTLTVGVPTTGLPNPGVTMGVTIAPPPVPAPVPTIFVRIDGQGGVSGDGGIACLSTGGTCWTAAPAGTTLVLDATGGSSGYTFAGWSGCTSVSGTQCTLVVAGSTTVRATYAPPPPPPPPAQYTLVARVYGGSGTIIGEGNAMNCVTNVGTCSIPVAVGGSVRLSASALPGSVFTGWSGCTTVTGATCDVTVTKVSTAMAKFEPAEFTISASTSGKGTVAGSGLDCQSNTLRCVVYAPRGTVLTTTATPAAGYVFSSWTGCPAPSGSTCTINVAGNTAFKANFVLAPQP